MYLRRKTTDRAKKRMTESLKEVQIESPVYTFIYMTQGKEHLEVIDVVTTSEPKEVVSPDGSKVYQIKIGEPEFVTVLSGKKNGYVYIGPDDSVFYQNSPLETPEGIPVNGCIDLRSILVPYLIF